MLKYWYILNLLLLAVSPQIQAQEKYTIQELQEDITFYRSMLEKHHPNLYLYSSKEKTDHFFDSLYQSVTAPMDAAAFYSSISLSASVIQDGHTLVLPSSTYIEYHNKHSKFLPWQIGLDGQRLYIRMNCTQHPWIEDGTVIDSINGISSAEIIRILTDRQVRDGRTTSYSTWILDTYFREYYSYMFGHPDTYRMSSTKNGQIYTTNIPALSKDSIYYYREKNYPAISFDKKAGEGILLSFDDSGKTAILTIKDFHSDILETSYHQNFRKTIRPLFDSILSKKAQSLIIDLRNNQGGDVENGVLLLSFLLSQPFQVVREFTCIRNGAPAPCKGPCMGIQSPDKAPFGGQVYVLVNGGSFSNTAIVSSCLKENRRAIFIGTETGGNPHVLAGYAKDFELPNTHIRVEIPEKRFVMTSLAANDGHGIIPDYIISNDISDNILQIDKVLRFTLTLAAKNNLLHK